MNPRFTYTKLNHFSNWLPKYIGEDNNDIPIHVINGVKKYMCRNNIDSKEITPSHVKMALKQLDLSKHVMERTIIFNKLTGTKPINLKKYEITTEEKQIDVPPDTVCSICLEIVEIDSIAKLKCNHYYHVSCIKAWQKIKSTCPYCIRVIEYEYDYCNKTTINVEKLLTAKFAVFVESWEKENKNKQVNFPRFESIYKMLLISIVDEHKNASLLKAR